MMLTTRLVRRTPVLQMGGAIAGERATTALAVALHRFDRIGIDSVVVDLTNVPRIDLRGLGILAEADRRFQKRGCHVTLVGVTARLRDLITITFLVTAFETHETVDAFVIDRGEQGSGSRSSFREGAKRSHRAQLQSSFLPFEC